MIATAYETSTSQDINNFCKDIVGLDEVNDYYLKKPSSQWLVTGLNNVSIFRAILPV